jgi:hypothetical protein
MEMIWHDDRAFEKDESPIFQPLQTGKYALSGLGSGDYRRPVECCRRNEIVLPDFRDSALAQAVASLCVAHDLKEFLNRG